MDDTGLERTLNRIQSGSSLPERQKLLRPDDFCRSPELGVTCHLLLPACQPTPQCLMLS